MCMNQRLLSFLSYGLMNRVSVALLYCAYSIAVVNIHIMIKEGLLVAPRLWWIPWIMLWLCVGVWAILS